MTVTLDRALPAADAGVVADGKPADPDPEVPERARRRTFTAKYKLEVLAAYDAAEPGEKGAILRRKGLYSSHNLVRQQSFSDRLSELMKRYTNQQTTAEIIAELVAMSKEVSADAARGTEFRPPLNPDELAFYDAVAQNESAVTEMGTAFPADIARDLVRALRRDITTDWVSRDDVRAKIRSTIKRLLVKYGYPPDAQPGAIELVLRQMETFAEDWSPEADH